MKLGLKNVIKNLWKTILIKSILSSSLSNTMLLGIMSIDSLYQGASLNTQKIMTKNPDPWIEKNLATYLT